jgi:Fe-S-cluster containining protein
MAVKCSGCGVCCRLFLISLSEEEYLSGKFRTQFESFGLTKDFVGAELCGANIIEQKEDGSCFYLKDSKCSIHDIRPEACRKFFCTSKSKAFKEMIHKIKERKLLLKLL